VYVRRLGPEPIQAEVQYNRKSCRSTMVLWVSRAAGHIRRRGAKEMPVPSLNRSSPVVPPRPASYLRNRKWIIVEPGAGFQSVPDWTEIVVFLPRNSLQQLLPAFRSGCPPPWDLKRHVLLGRVPMWVTSSVIRPYRVRLVYSAPPHPFQWRPTWGGATRTHPFQ